MNVKLDFLFDFVISPPLEKGAESEDKFILRHPTQLMRSSILQAGGFVPTADRSPFYCRPLAL